MTTPPPVAYASAKPKRPSFWPQRLVALAVIFFVFAVACCMPGITFLKNGVDHSTMWGFALLLIGWSGIFAGQFAWFANCFLFLAWILLLCRLWIAAAVVTLFAVLIAMDTYAWFGQSLPADEGGVNHMQMESVGIAFYVWLLSMLVTIICAIILRTMDRKLRQSVAV